jgi:hypothetical protein
MLRENENVKKVHLMGLVHQTLAGVSHAGTQADCREDHPGGGGDGPQAAASPSETSFPLKAGANPTEKIRLFMSLFKGRDDLYAKRWESREGRSGYAPVCLNEWKPGFCGKPEVKCAFCEHRSYAALDEKVIEAHLRGKLVAGVYPLRQDEKCHFLAIDFDKDGWQEDVATLKDVCTAFAVPVAIERSRSGHGAHAGSSSPTRLPPVWHGNSVLRCLPTP